MVFYITKIMLVISSKDVSFYRFPQPHCISCDILLLFGSYCLEVKASGVIFLPFLLCPHSCWSKRWTYILAALSSLCPCGSDAVLIAHCPAALQVLLLSFFLTFIAVPPMIAVSSLNDQFGWMSFCISALGNSQQWSVSSDNMPMCSSSYVAILISFVVMQSRMSMHDCVVLMVMCMPVISLSQFVSCLCLYSQFAVNSYAPGLYSILILYQCILNGILWILYHRIAVSFLKLLQVACDLQSLLFHGQNSSDNIFLGHA